MVIATEIPGRSTNGRVSSGPGAGLCSGLNRRPCVFGALPEFLRKRQMSIARSLGQGAPRGEPLACRLARQEMDIGIHGEPPQQSSKPLFDNEKALRASFIVR
jgi:hypothetical protein